MILFKIYRDLLVKTNYKAYRKSKLFQNYPEKFQLPLNQFLFSKSEAIKHVKYQGYNQF